MANTTASGIPDVAKDKEQPIATPKVVSYGELQQKIKEGIQEGTIQKPTGGSAESEKRYEESAKWIAENTEPSEENAFVRQYVDDLSARSSTPDIKQGKDQSADTPTSDEEAAKSELKRQNKTFELDKHAWANTEGTTGSKRNETDKDDGTYHWKGHTDENGNFISGLEEWTTDNETRLKVATDFATDGTWHTEEEMQLYQQEAANLYYDNIELENYVQEKVDAFKAEYDQKYASASEEEKATLDAILESNNAYLSHVQGMKEQSKNVYDTLASNNEYFGQWDRMEDVTAYVNDPKAYEKVGGTPEQLNTKLEAAQAVIESIEKRKNKYIGLSKEEKATLSEAKTTVSQLLGSDTKPGLIKQAEDIAKERREYAEDFNRNQLYGREYAIKKNADGSIGSYSMSDWREEEARLETMLKTTSESSPSYAEISSKLKYIRDNYTDNYAKDEIRQKYASATDEEINAKIASLESNQPVVQQTNNVSAQLEQARKDLKALESQAMAKPEEYLAAKARVDELEAAQKTGTEAPKPVENKVLTYSEQLELDTLKEIQANRLNANVLQNYKDYQDKFGAEGALQWQNATQESIATARQERDAEIAHWQEAGAALGEYYVIPKTGDFADIRAALKAANISEDDTTRAAAFIQNHIDEVSRNSSIAIAGLEYENAVATVARDIDLSQAKDYDSTVKKAKDKYSVEEMRTAFNSVQDVMWDINGGVSDGTKSRGILAGLGITGKEADELMKMITTYGLDVSYLTPTTAETDANADPKNFYAYGQKRGFFSEEQVNNWYYLLEHDGAVAAAKYAIGINNVLNSEYRNLLEENKAGVLAYDAKNHTANFVGQALAAQVVTPLMGMTSPIDYIKLRDQVARLGTDIVNPKPSIAEYGNMITELYTNQIDESAGKFAGLANFAYGVYGSTIQSLEVAAVGGLLGKALGFADTLTIMGKGAQNLTAGMFSDLSFFSSAAVQSYHDFREKGIDPQRALSAATWAGIAEAAFEHISFEKLYHAKDVFDWTSWKDWAVETAVSGAIEGSEEVFTSMANFLSEAAILGKDGSYWKAVEEYEKLGLDQNTAMKKAMWDTVQNWAVDFAAGAVSGGISVGSSSAFNYKAYTNEINESAKKLGARINDAKIEGDKTLAQKMGEYFGSYEYYNGADSIKPNKQQLDEVNTLKNLADKAAKGEASADEIGQMVVLANRYSEKLFTDFVFANTKTFMAISPGLVIDAATKGLNAVFGKEETQKILTAFYEHPDAFVEDSFEVGLKNAVGDKLSSDEIENIEYLLGYVLTGNNAYTEEDLRNSIRNLITDEGVQNFILSYFKEQIDQYNHPKGRFALFGKSTDSATQPWFVHTTNENTMTGSFEDVLVNVWNGTKTAAHYVTMQKQAIDSVNNAFQSLSDAINQASTKAAQYRDAGDFFVAKGPDGKDHIYTREFFIQQHKKGVDPLTGKPSAFRDLVDTDEKLNAEFDGQLRATIGAGGLADMVRYNLRTGEEKSAEQTQKLKDQLQDILSVPDANVAILRNEIRDIDRQLQDLYTQAEMAKASNEPLPDQHDAAVKNLEERKARAEADLKIIQERAKVRSNGRIQTHDSGTSGRNGSTDERRNAGGIPYSGTGSDSGISAGQSQDGQRSGSGSGSTLRQEVILKEGDDALASMENGSIIYDSSDPKASTDNLTSEEKDVLQMAKDAGVDRLIFVDADQLYGNGNRAAGYYVIINGKKTIVVNSNRGTVNGYHEAMHYCLDSYSKEEKRSLLDKFIVGLFGSKEEFKSFINLYNNEVHQKVYAPLYAAFKNGNTQPYYYALYEEILCDLWKGLNRYHISNEQFAPLQQRAYAFVVENQIIEHAADKAKQNKGAEKSEPKKAPETHGGIPRAETPKTKETSKAQEAPKVERTAEEQKAVEFFDFLVRQSDDFDIDPFVSGAPDDLLQYISGLNGANDAEKQVIAAVKKEVERRQAEDRRAEEENKPQSLDTSIGEARLAQVRENVHNLSEAELVDMMRQMADLLGKLSKDNPDRIILEPVANILINEYRNRLTERGSESSEEEGTVISDNPAGDLPKPEKKTKSTDSTEQPTTTEEQPAAEQPQESTGNPLQDELNGVLQEIAEYDRLIAENVAERDRMMKEAADKDTKDIIKGQANQLIKILKDERAELQKRATAIRSQILKENKKNKNNNRGSVIEANAAKGSKKTPNHTADTHIDNRSLDSVGETNVNAFQYDNPEIKPFFKRAAEILLRDLIYLQTTRRNEYGKGTFFEVDTDFLEAVRNNFKSINDAVAACEAVIYDKGGENYVGPKRIEIFLDQMLTNGYTPINQDSKTIEPSIDYINLKGSLEGGTPFDARQKAIDDLRLAYLDDGLTDEELGRIVDENKARTGYYDPDTKDGLGEVTETTTETTEVAQEETAEEARTAGDIDAEMDQVSADIEELLGRLEDVEGQVSPETIDKMQSRLRELEAYYDSLVDKLNDAYANGRFSTDDAYTEVTPDIYNKFSVESLANGTGVETLYQITGSNKTTTLEDWIAANMRENPELTRDSLQNDFSQLVESGAARVIGVARRDPSGNLIKVEIDEITPAAMKNSPLGQMITYAKEFGKISEEEANRQYGFLADLVKLLYSYDDTDFVWRVVGSEMFAAIKNNSDPQYGKTIDFSTICKKTQATVDAISKTMKLLGTGLSKEEIKFVYKMVGEAGESTPCPVCYVFSRWMGLGSVLDNIKRYQDMYGDRNPKGQEEALKLVKEVQDRAMGYIKGRSFGKAVNAAQADILKKLKAAEENFQNYPLAQLGSKDKKINRSLIDENGKAVTQDYWADQISTLAADYDKFDAYKWAIKTRLINAELLVKNAEDIAAKLRKTYKIKGDTVEAVLENALQSPNTTDNFTDLVNELSDNVADLKLVEPDRLNKLKRKYALKKSQSGLKGVVTKLKKSGQDITEAQLKVEENVEEYKALIEALGTDDYVFRKGYKDVPDDILFDLNKGEQFARYYPETWTYRTTRGSGLGKAIMPYSDARVGEIVQGVALGDVKGVKIGKDQNAFLDLLDPRKKNEAERILATARKKMAAQNLIGGMRFQSTSDFRYEYASDYLMAFFEMQAMGANVQLYTKVLEAVDFFANVGCDVNLSVMPRDKGIGVLNEKPRDWDTNYDRYYTLEDGKYLKLNKGKSAPEFEPGKYHAILYSDVTGVNGGAAREYVNKYDNVQMIMVGISADHINACLDSDDITFVIPFHGSGNSTADIQQLMQLLGESIDRKNITDFTDYQTDAQRETKNDARDLRHKIVSGKLLTTDGQIILTAEEANILESNEILRDLFRRFYLDATDKNGRIDIGLSKENREKVSVIRTNKDGSHTKLDTPDFGKVNDKAFAKKYYLDGRNECYGNFLSGAAANQIFPYEYWDKSLKQSEAKGNGDAFQAYAKSLGLVPRFSGFAKGKDYKAELDFTKNDNYWKLLIDRKMYDNQGNYRAQRQINLSEVDIGGSDRFDFTSLNPVYGEVNFGSGSEFANRVNPKAPGKDNSVISKINDPKKSDAIAQISAKAIRETRALADKSYGHMFSNNEDIQQAMENKDYITAAQMLRENPTAVFNEQTGQLEVVEEPSQEVFMDDYDTEGKFSVDVTDPTELAWLNKLYEDGDVVYTYKSYLEYEDENGIYLIAPMAGLQKDEKGNKQLSHKLRPMHWEKSIGNPNSKNIKKNKKGKWEYHLEKSDADSPVDAAYNPYQHSGDLAINDQFAIAYRRPQLVTYICAIPKSELEGKYHYGVTDPENARRADGEIVTAKDPVGILDWKTGAFGSQLFNSKRHTYLSRWLMPIQRLSDEEVARQYKEIVDREPAGLGVPFNVVTQNVRNILEDMGVPIDITGTGIREDLYGTYLKDVNEQRIAEGKEPYPYSFIRRTDKEKKAINKQREKEAKRMREERGEEWANQIVGDLNAKRDNSFAVKENKRGQYQIDFDSAETPTVRYSADDAAHNGWAPIFYSKMRQAIEEWVGGNGQKLPPKMGAGSVESWLKGKGVKEEEIKWSGIRQYLEGKKSVTRDELLKVMDENEYRIETVLIKPNSFVPKSYIDDNGKEYADGEAVYQAATELANNLGMSFWDLSIEHDEDGSVTYYITDPEDNSRKDLMTFRVKPSYESSPTSVDRTEKGIRWFSTNVNGKRIPLTLPGNENYREILFKDPKSRYSNFNMGLHWDDEKTGVLAHARVDDMTTKDGDSVFFVEEIQSDWHNAGVKWGFDDPVTKQRQGYIDQLKEFEKVLRVINNKLYHSIYEIARDYRDLFGSSTISTDSIDRWLRGQANTPLAREFDIPDGYLPLATALFEEVLFDDENSLLSPEQQNEVRRIRDAVKEIDEFDRKHPWTNWEEEYVPDAPYAGAGDSYNAFVMKNLLRMAAEGDYDKIGWTTGDQQAKRWDSELWGQKDEKADAKNRKAYETNYDTKIPSFMNKYCKQWGSKVSTVELENGETVWSVDITPQMKEDVLTKGQPRYSVDEQDFMSGVIDDNSNYTIDGFFNSLGEEVTVGKFSVDDILSVTYFAGAGTFDYALRDRLFPIYAVEYDPAIRDMFVKNNGNSILITDADVNEVNPRTVLAGHVPYFHASPVCTNFSKANNKSGETERDRKFARAIAKALHAWQPDAFTLENVKGYIGSDSLQIVLDALDELGYSHDGYEGNVYRASDYGAATIRDRLFVRAVKDGELPPKPVKTGPTSWWSAVEDIIDTLPVMDESGLTEARRTRLRNMGIDINNLKQPILLLSGTKGREIQYAYADQPSPTLMTDGSEARIILTDGTILKVTPRVYARIQGLDDEFQFPTQKRNPDKIHQSDAFKIIGNGIPTQLTQAVVNPLLDIIDKHNGKYSADDEQMASTLQMYEDLVDPSEWKASEHQNMNEQMYNRISDGISLWDKVVSFYDTVDKDNYNWLSYDDITQAMRINPFNGNIDGEDMPLASEVMWSLLHLARDQGSDVKERIYRLMEEIAPHLMRTEQDKWIRPVSSRFPPIDFDFSNWYNERNPMPEVGYTPKPLEQLHQEAIEATNEANFQRRAYRRSLATEDEYNRAAEKARRAWNMYSTRFNAEQGKGKFSVDIDPDAAFDSFGYEVELDDYSPVVTQSDLSDKLYYSDDGNTAYYMTDTGETVVLNNVGTDSPEARYIEYLEAMQNANDINTTATKPYIIPPANRNGYDGYNLYQPNAGLRYGAEEVLEENQKGTLRPAGSNGELYAEGVPQSEETQGVRYSAEEESPGARYSTMYDADSDTFVNEKGETVATDDMYPIGSFTREIFKAMKSGDQSLKNVEDLINKLLDRKFNIYEEDYNTVRQMIQINDAYTPEQRKAMLDAMEKLVKKHGKMRSAKEDMNQDLHFAVQRDQGDTIDDPNHKGKKITRKEFVKRATEGKDPFTGEDSDKTMTEKEANKLFDQQGTVIMKFLQTTARNSDKEWLTAEAVRMALTDESMSYTPMANDEAIRRAQQRFDRAGSYEKALAEWDGIVHSERTPKQVDVAFGELLLKSAAEQGRINDTVKLVSDLTLMAHTTGQTLQAFRILKKMTPRGQLYYIQSVVDDLNKRYDSRIKNGKMGRVTLNQDLVELLLSSSTREELDKAVDLIKKDLAEQIPATWMDQWNAWRYLAMLGNPRTHFRNIFGNGAFMPAVFIKDMISRRLETKYVDPKLRMRIAGADLSKNSAYRQRAEQDFKVMAKIIAGEAGGNKYSDIQDILGQRDVFPFQWLNDLARFNGGRLSAEDLWFMHKYYTRAFAEALQARGIKEEDVQNFDTNPEGRKILNEVRNWAMEEAQRNTYHDANKLASLLNQMKRSSPAAYVVLEGLVPFTKTPANILKRGIEYSPIGLISSYIQLGRDLRSGEYSTSQCIDRLAAGWTGTGFLILGFILSKLGILRGGGPDDKKEEAFESLQGHQPWSIEIGGLSYTLDWMAPLALPLFVGATIYSMLKGDHVDITDADTWMALTRIADPLLSLSMLDGIENTLSAVSNANNTSKLGVLGISMLGSYIAQGMPTIFGQAARILDTNRRKTFVPEDAKSSALKQWVQSSIQAKIPDPLRLFGGNIPGTEDDKKLYVDMWGRTEGADTFGEVLWKIAENVISPGYHKWINETPVDAELQRLYEATEDKSVLPGYVDKSIGPQSQGKDDEGNEIIIDGKKLTADEMTKYEMTVGQNRYQLLNDIFASPEYQAATETEKKKIVNDAYAYAKSLGEKAVIAGRDHDSEWMNLADKIGASDYILIRQEYESNKSNEKIFSWLVNNPNLNESQVATLIADKFNPPDNIESISTSGFLYDLKGSDEDAIKEINAQIIKDGLRELYRSEEYQNAPDKDVMLRQFYEESKAETIRLYGEMLDQTDRVKYVGKAATIGAESFNKVLDLTTADVKGDYRSNIEAQSSWLGYKYKADTSINNPLHEGYSIELDKTQRSRLESKFRDRWNEAYDELLHSEKFQNAPSREYQEDMIARRFNQVSTEVENEYAAELYQAGGYSETFGKPGSFTWSKAYEIADRELSTPKEQAEWLAGKYSPGSSIDDPDQAAYEIALTTEDKNQLKKEFASAYVPRYVKMVNSDEFKALDPTTQEYKKEELRKDVAKSVQEAYARKLKADGYASVAFDDKANLANKYEYLASNDLSDKEKIEIIKDSYVGGTIANAEARGYRKKMFDEWMDNPANTKSYLEQNTAAAYEKMRKAADKYAGDLTKKKYGGVKNFNQIEDFDLYDVYYTTDNPIDSTPPVKIDAPATSKTDSGALIRPGNIDLDARPIVRNSDGSYSTVDTVTWEVDGQYINVPTVIYVDGETINGEYVEGWVHVDDDAALEHYYETGEHLGIYSDKDSAVKAAEQLHKDQAKQYDSQANFWAGLIRH